MIRGCTVFSIACYWAVVTAYAEPGSGRAGEATAESRPVVASRPASRPAVEDALTLDLGNRVTMRFVRIPEGECLIGSTRGNADEKPVHRVRFEKGWLMGRFEVTNQQYRRYKAEHDSGEFRGHDLNASDQPVVQVSWHDARAFCDWLTRQTGRACRLPTEAEWEYACRAGSLDLYTWGDDLGQAARFCNGFDDRARRKFKFSWAAFPGDDGFVVSAPVGSLQPNRWGLYDMHGNVWEWCADEYRPTYAVPESAPASRPTTSPLEMRVHRGGSWVLGPNACRSAARGRGRPEFHSSSLGFRVVVDLP